MAITTTNLFDYTILDGDVLYGYDVIGLLLMNQQSYETYYEMPTFTSTETAYIYSPKTYNVWLHESSVSPSPTLDSVDTTTTEDFSTTTKWKDYDPSTTYSVVRNTSTYTPWVIFDFGSTISSSSLIYVKYFFQRGSDASNYYPVTWTYETSNFRYVKISNDNLGNGKLQVSTDKSTWTDLEIVSLPSSVDYIIVYEIQLFDTKLSDDTLYKVSADNTVYLTRKVNSNLYNKYLTNTVSFGTR